MTTHLGQQVGVERGAKSEGKGSNGFPAQLSRVGPPMAPGGGSKEVMFFRDASDRNLGDILLVLFYFYAHIMA